MGSWSLARVVVCVVIGAFGKVFLTQNVSMGTSFGSCRHQTTLHGVGFFSYFLRPMPFFLIYYSYMSTIYRVRYFLSHRFFVKVVAALWILLGVAYKITSVAV